jgi:hypothetical protein
MDIVGSVRGLEVPSLISRGDAGDASVSAGSSGAVDSAKLLSIVCLGLFYLLCARGEGVSSYSLCHHCVETY